MEVIDRDCPTATPATTEVYACEHCDYSCEHKSKLKRHYARAHVAEYGIPAGIRSGPQEETQGESRSIEEENATNDNKLAAGFAMEAMRKAKESVEEKGGRCCIQCRQSKHGGKKVFRNVQDLAFHILNKHVWPTEKDTPDDSTLSKGNESAKTGLDAYQQEAASSTNRSRVSASNIGAKRRKMELLTAQAKIGGTSQPPEKPQNILGGNYSLARSQLMSPSQNLVKQGVPLTRPHTLAAPMLTHWNAQNFVGRAIPVPYPVYYMPVDLNGLPVSSAPSQGPAMQSTPPSTASYCEALQNNSRESDDCSPCSGREHLLTVQKAALNALVPSLGPRVSPPFLRDPKESKSLKKKTMSKAESKASPRGAPRHTPKRTKALSETQNEGREKKDLRSPPTNAENTAIGGALKTTRMTDQPPGAQQRPRSSCIADDLFKREHDTESTRHTPKGCNDPGGGQIAAAANNENMSVPAEAKNSVKSEPKLHERGTTIRNTNRKESIRVEPVVNKGGVGNKVLGDTKLDMHSSLVDTEPVGFNLKRGPVEVVVEDETLHLKKQAKREPQIATTGGRSPALSPSQKTLNQRVYVKSDACPTSEPQIGRSPEAEKKSNTRNGSVGHFTEKEEDRYRSASDHPKPESDGRSAQNAKSIEVTSVRMSSLPRTRARRKYANPYGVKTEGAPFSAQKPPVPFKVKTGKPLRASIAEARNQQAALRNLDHKKVVEWSLAKLENQARPVPLDFSVGLGSFRKKRKAKNKPTVPHE